MTEGLAAQTLRLCREKGLTVAAAESCTGGMIASRITGVPGASQVFLGGVVSYTNGVKEQVLHVPGSLLTLCGAVSAPVARAMAMGVRLLTGADIAVAGPDGDDRGNPVGTVFVALSAGTEIQVRQLALTGSREDIRRQSTDNALEMICSCAACAEEKIKE